MFTRKEIKNKVFKKQTNITDATLLLVIILCLPGNDYSHQAHLVVNQEPRSTILSRWFLTPKHIQAHCTKHHWEKKKQNTKSLTLPKNWTEPSNNIPIGYFIPQRAPPNFWAKYPFLWLKGCNLIIKNEVFIVYQAQKYNSLKMPKQCHNTSWFFFHLNLKQELNSIDIQFIDTENLFLDPMEI